LISVDHRAAKGIKLDQAPEQSCELDAALTNGLAIERIANPTSVPEDLLGETLSLIHDGLVLRAGAAG
jgi:hypothetical protein